jgi:hypothetical protein
MEQSPSKRYRHSACLIFNMDETQLSSHEKRKARHRAYYARNRERLLAERRNRRAIDPEFRAKKNAQLRASYRKYKKRRLLMAKCHRADNPELYYEIERKKRIKHAEAIKKRKRAYFEKNKARILAHYAKYEKERRKNDPQ